MKKIFLLDETTEEWKECNRCMPLDVIGGLDPNEVSALRRLDVDRPYLVMSWIQSLIMLRSETPEGLRVPPPILSRVHQVLSDGFLAGSSTLTPLVCSFICDCLIIEYPVHNSGGAPPLHSFVRSFVTV